MKRLHIYGKKNCPKCELLKRRIHDLLPSEDIVYSDLTKIPDIVDFCRQERLSPLKIPILLIETQESPTSPFRPLERDISDSFENCIYQWVGLYTDYSKDGTLPPEMLSTFIEKYYKKPA